MTVRLGDLIVSALPCSSDPDATVAGSGVIRGVLASVNGDGTCNLRRRDTDWVALMPAAHAAVIVPDPEFTDAEREWVPLARAVVAERSQKSFVLPEAPAFSRHIADNVLGGILEAIELEETEDGTRRIRVDLDREPLGEYALAPPDEDGVVFRYWFGRLPGLMNRAAADANRFSGLCGDKPALDPFNFSLSWRSEHGPEGIVSAAA